MSLDSSGVATIERRFNTPDLMWQGIRADSQAPNVSRTNFWDVRCPVRVGGSGQGVISRHPDDMRAPSRAVTFLLPMCQPLSQSECPARRVE